MGFQYAKDLFKKMHSEKKKHIDDQLERPYYISQHDRSR